MNNEIAKLLRLTPTSLEPVSIFAPRRSSRVFQKDLFPDVLGEVAPHSLNGWMLGCDLMPSKISLEKNTREYLDEELARSSLAALNIDDERKDIKKNDNNFNVNNVRPVSARVDSKVSSFTLSTNSRRNVQSVKILEKKSSEEIERERLEEQLKNSKKRIFDLETKARKAGINIS